MSETTMSVYWLYVVQIEYRLLELYGVMKKINDNFKINFMRFLSCDLYIYIKLFTHNSVEFIVSLLLLYLIQLKYVI